MSLVQSAAYPPTSQLDAQLDELLNDQRKALNQLARIDTEAAQLVANHLSGYATLRKFYDLRDENEDNTDSRRSGLRPFARKREAAKAIVALIESAADTIRGGLYDSEIAAVVQLDTLLALLAEALPLMNRECLTFTLKFPMLTIYRHETTAQAATADESTSRCRRFANGLIARLRAS